MRFFLLLFATFSFSAVAQVYKWTDENGNVHFGNQPPPGQQEEVRIRESSPGDMGKARRDANNKTVSESEIERDKAKDALADARETANQRACDLAQTELENAERLLTLAQSQDSYDFVLERRQKSVEHWQSRVDLHCKDPG